MMRMMRILAVVTLVIAMATMGYAQGGAMTPEQTKMMSDQMKSGKMTADQMKMMAEHMQMMADRMKDGQMTPDQMKKMNENMMKCCKKGMMQ